MTADRCAYLACKRPVEWVFPSEHGGLTDVALWRCSEHKPHMGTEEHRWLTTDEWDVWKIDELLK